MPVFAMKTFFYRFYTHLQRVIEALIHDDTDNLIFDHFMTWYIYPYLITLDDCHDLNGFIGFLISFILII